MMAGSTERSDVLGIDIGGVHLKYATIAGECLDRPFPLWTRWQELSDQLASDISRFRGIRRLAITMTGELADCFAARSVGVSSIVDHVMRCLTMTALQSAAFYGTDGRFHDAGGAKHNWECVAASNWHALATCVGSRLAKDALLIDVGSTTTDVIAICEGEVLTRSRTDFTRLGDLSLVYVGCRRTPVCALVSELEIDGRFIPVMNEVFATIDDARLLTGTQAEDPSDMATADSHPRDRAHARIRLARMIGLDSDQVSDRELEHLATQIQRSASRRIDVAVDRWWQILSSQTESPPTCVLSGHGQDLVGPPGDCDVIDLRTQLPRGVSRAAPAWAVAVLLPR
ncbi:hydantoinase/oxoprolinase family protein [Allorhodopirellula solitaria]|uniref:Hydantoinase/oxoprolinase n=1 Tax=Allorhodopirellula solitaria TaxID=2527987 RepID=A0A5C5YD10_9BACT|nr:hydantoinase/oxoprolinase family protein [Allorhodopirellula solitaria]TWT73260.1 Hydantoinase/oxoprolinase [Allorhodopirellula solitaria]